jgi:hypothetical protein
VRPAVRGGSLYGQLSCRLHESCPYKGVGPAAEEPPSPPQPVTPPRAPPHRLHTRPSARARASLAHPPASIRCSHKLSRTDSTRAASQRTPGPEPLPCQWRAVVGLGGGLRWAVRAPSSASTYAAATLTQCALEVRVTRARGNTLAPEQACDDQLPVAWPVRGAAWASLPQRARGAAWASLPQRACARCRAQVVRALWSRLGCAPHVTDSTHAW